MSYHAHDTYLESRILSADPVELTRMLFQACTTAVRDARRQLAAGEIRERAQSISRACEILFELDHALDHERGGEISRNLGQLYDYMQRQLLDANSRQADGPLAETLGLLTTVSEAWDGVAAPAPEAVRADNRWPEPMAEPEMAECSAGGWSF